MARLHLCMNLSEQAAAGRAPRGVMRASKRAWARDKRREKTHRVLSLMPKLPGFYFLIRWLSIPEKMWHLGVAATIRSKLFFTFMIPCNLPPLLFSPYLDGFESLMQIWAWKWRTRKEFYLDFVNDLRWRLDLWGGKKTILLFFSGYFSDELIAALTPGPKLHPTLSSL